jgi:hypothetical protein
MMSYLLYLLNYYLGNWNRFLSFFIEHILMPITNGNKNRQVTTLMDLFYVQMIV